MKSAAEILDVGSINRSSLDCSIWHFFCSFFYSQVCSDQLCVRNMLDCRKTSKRNVKKAKRMPDTTAKTTTVADSEIISAYFISLSSIGMKIEPIGAKRGEGVK